MPTLRQEGDVIAWTNDKSADIAKGTLVHIGGGRFGVTVNAVADGASGLLLVKGGFDGGTAVADGAISKGNMLQLSSETALSTLKLKVMDTTATATQTIVGNVRAPKAYTSGATITDFDLIG